MAKTPFMRKVPLGIVKMESSGNIPEVTLSYRDQMIIALETPFDPQKGTNYAEMRLVTPIIEKLESCGPDDEYVLMDESEYTEVTKRLEKMRFVKNNRKLQEMIRAIIDSEKVSVGVCAEQVAG